MQSVPATPPSGHRETKLQRRPATRPGQLESASWFSTCILLERKTFERRRTIPSQLARRHENSICYPRLSAQLRLEDRKLQAIVRRPRGCHFRRRGESFLWKHCLQGRWPRHAYRHRWPAKDHHVIPSSARPRKQTQGRRHRLRGRQSGRHDQRGIPHRQMA